MLITTARFPTAQASKYLQQLCKHFAHKAEVTHTETTGRIVLTPGLTTLLAEDMALSVRIESADAKALIQARYVIDSHLVTFAFRENFTGFAWALETA